MVNTLKDRLELAMNGPPKVSQAALARACRVKPPSVNAWLTGDTKRIDGEKLFRAANFLGVNPEWLAGISNVMRIDANDPRKFLGSDKNLMVRDGEVEYLPGDAKAGYKRLRLMERYQSPGWGLVNKDYPEVLESIDIAEWKVKQQIGFLPTDDRVQLMTNRGSSNYPKIKDGDVVMVDTSQTVFGGDDFYLVDLHGHVVIKRLQLMLDGMHISSTNQDYKSEVIPAKQMNSLPIVGRIVGFAQFRRAEEV